MDRTMNKFNIILINEFDLEKVLSILKFTNEQGGKVFILNTTKELEKLYEFVYNFSQTKKSLTKTLINNELYLFDFPRIFQIFISLYNFNTTYEFNYSTVQELFKKFISRFVYSVSKFYQNNCFEIIFPGQVFRLIENGFILYYDLFLDIQYEENVDFLKFFIESISRYNNFELNFTIVTDNSSKFVDFISFVKNNGYSIDKMYKLVNIKSPNDIIYLKLTKRLSKKEFDKYVQQFF